MELSESTLGSGDGVFFAGRIEFPYIAAFCPGYGEKDESYRGLERW